MTDGDADADGRETDQADADRWETDEGTRRATDNADGASSGSKSGPDGSEDDAVTAGTAAVADYTTGRRTISGRVRVIWGARIAVLALVIGAIATVAADATEAVPTVAAPALAGLVVAVGLPWVHLRYRAWAFELRDDALYLERGVFTRVKSIVPFVRIQHVDTQRGPMERSLGLSTLVVYTAGTRGADVSIPGLTPEEASDLQRRVKELAIESEGGDAV